MEPVRNLVSVLLMCLIFKHSDATLTCNLCTSTINQNNVETVTDVSTGVNQISTSTYSCAKAVGIPTTSTTQTYQGCLTTYQYAQGLTTITRGMNYDDTQGNYCTNTINPNKPAGYSTTCTCNSTSNCNSDVVTVPTTYECYECQSSDYFDNGCGSTVVPGSIYVQTVQGCSACFKNLITTTDLSQVYVRGCTRSVNVDETCANTLIGQEGKSCACKNNLCNSAETPEMKSTIIYAAVLFSAAFKLIC